MVFLFPNKYKIIKYFFNADRCLVCPEQLVVQNDKEPIDPLHGLGAFFSYFYGAWGASLSVCFSLSWFNGNPLLVHHLQGLWNHVSRVHYAALYAQQQAAGMIILRTVPPHTLPVSTSPPHHLPLFFLPSYWESGTSGMTLLPLFSKNPAHCPSPPKTSAPTSSTSLWSCVLTARALRAAPTGELEKKYEKYHNILKLLYTGWSTHRQGSAWVCTWLEGVCVLGGGYNYKAIMTIIKCFYAENESALLNAFMQKT